MKFPLFLALVAISVSPCRALAEDAADLKPVWDFAASTPEYGYEKWSDLGAIGKKEANGWTVDGPAAGGFGLYFNTLLDLEDASKLRVRLVVNAATPGERLMFKFHAADGKQAVWYVPLANFEAGTESEFAFDLAKPDELLQPEPLDLGIIRQIQVQGSFNPEGRMNVTFVSLGAELNK